MDARANSGVTVNNNAGGLIEGVNSLCCLTFNRRHGRSGHVFGGRYKALHVDRDAYLVEVCRYVDLNPVRAGLVASPGQWAWSSYRARTGAVPPPPWLATDELHGVVAGRIPVSAVQRFEACRRYAECVEAGRGLPLRQSSLRQGLHLGDEAFIERIQRAGA